MNLKERFEILKLNFPKLVLNVRGINNNNRYQVYNLHNFRDAFYAVRDLDIFTKTTKELEEGSRIFTTAGEGLVIDENELEFVNSRLNSLKSDIALIEKFFGNDIEVTEDMLEIKLPEDTNSFDELSKVANKLKLSIEQAVYSMQIEGGMVKIVSAEPGSIWLIIKLGAALSFIGKLLDKAVFIGNEIQKFKANETYLKHIGANEEYIKSIQDLAQTHLKTISEAQAKALLEGEMKANDPVLIQTLELALNSITELQSKGAKFLPVSKDPNITQFFPKETDAKLPFNPSKQIHQ